MNIEFMNKAIIFAAEAHSTQYRKGTDIPYIIHPLEVGVIASTMTDNDETVAAAYLHDTLEDTEVTKEILIAEFGERVAELVAAESENKRDGQEEIRPWETRKQETVKHLKNCNDIDVKIIALSDKLANIRAIYRDYCAIEEKLWDRFNQHDPAKIKWYYTSFLDACKELENEQAYTEYAELVSKVFDRY